MVPLSACIRYYISIEMRFPRSKMMDKLYKTVLVTMTAALILICSACTDAPTTNQIQDPDAEKTLSLNINFPNLPQNSCVIPLSAKWKEGIQELQNKLIEITTLPDLSQNDVVVSNIRHYEALTHALEAIHRVQDGLAIQLSGDLVSQDLRECLFHLAEIVGGEITTNEVLGNIFKNFCIGK